MVFAVLEFMKEQKKQSALRLCVVCCAMLLFYVKTQDESTCVIHWILT